MESKRERTPGRGKGSIEKCKSWKDTEAAAAVDGSGIMGMKRPAREGLGGDDDQLPKREQNGRANRDV